MAERSRRTLLTPGHEDAWAAINTVEDAERVASTAGMTIAELVERGLELSALAYDISSAVSAAQPGGRPT